MPNRLVSILNQNTPHTVRLVETKERTNRKQDLVFFRDKDQAMDVLESADIIHLHNNIDFSEKEFSPVDFAALRKRGTRFVRQYHSIPGTIARKMGISAEEFLNQGIPGIVIGQYPERYYPNAYVVPNPIPLDDPLYRPVNGEKSIDVLFTPSKDSSAWGFRWGTKGKPETSVLLKKIRMKSRCSTKVMYKQPLNTVLEEKQRSYLNLEEMITGSYHLSGLEGLSMGNPTLCYLDRRTERVLKYLSGSAEIPFINVVLENAEEVILYLLYHRDEGAAIGTASRKWMETYWNVENLSSQFVTMYEKLVDNPELLTKQKDLAISSPVDTFFQVTVNDLIYESRRKRKYYTNLRTRVAVEVYKFRKLRRRIKKYLKLKFFTAKEL